MNSFDRWWAKMISDIARVPSAADNKEMDRRLAKILSVMTEKQWVRILSDLRSRAR